MSQLFDPIRPASAPGPLQLVNARSYAQLWLRELPLLLLALGLCAWAALSGYAGPALAVAALGLLYLAQDQHPQRVVLTADTITLTYYQRFGVRQLTWPRADTEVAELSKPGSLLSSRAVYELRLTHAGKGFTLSTADGFTQAQLQQLYDELVPPVEAAEDADLS